MTRRAGMPPRRRAAPLHPRQPRIGVAEAVELHAHPVHDAEVQAAHLAVLVAGVEVVERAAGFERAAQAAGERPPATSCCRACVPNHMFERNIRQELSSTVPSPSGMASSFARGTRAGSRGSARCARSRRTVVVRRGVVAVAHFQERIVQRRKVAAQQQRGDAGLVRLERRAR